MDEVLSVAPSDSELESRARSLLRWKIRFNSVHVAAVSGHVTLSGEVITALDRENAEPDHSQTEGRGRRHKLHHCRRSAPRLDIK